MNQIMSESGGIRIIGGHSVGAQTALSGLVQNPTLYQRVLLISPFFKISEAKKSFDSSQYNWLKILQTIAGPLNAKKAEFADLISRPRSPLNWLSKKKQSWGIDCWSATADGGRAGYCEFTINAVSADQQLSIQTLNRLKSIKKLPPIQIFAVEQDPTASTISIRSFVNQVTLLGSEKPSICFYTKEANHDLISRYESPKENKFWMPSFFVHATRFALDGTRTPTHGALASEAGAPECNLTY